MNKRIVGYDIARALAIFGMVVVNFKIAMGAEKSGPDWLIQLAGLLDGRAAATFVVLAGIGISLLTRKARESGDAGSQRQARITLLKRAAFLFVVGLAYTPVWPADILHFYGVYIAVAAFVFAVPTRRLWALAAALVIAFVALFAVFPYDTGWDWQSLEYSGFWTAPGIVRHLFYNGFHPVIPWLAFLLVGLVIGRLDMADRAVRRRVALWGLGVAVLTEAASWLLVRTLSVGTSGADLGVCRAFRVNGERESAASSARRATVAIVHPTAMSLDKVVGVVRPRAACAGKSDRPLEGILAIFGTEPMPPLPLYMLAGAATACFIIAVSVSVGERFGESAILRPLVYTGQLALTLYVGHVLVGMGTLEEMGRLENQALSYSVGASVIFCVGAVLFSWGWRSRFKRGPLEAVMRWMTDPRTKAAT